MLYLVGKSKKNIKNGLAIRPPPSPPLLAIPKSIDKNSKLTILRIFIGKIDNISIFFYILFLTKWIYIISKDIYYNIILMQILIILNFI